MILSILEAPHSILQKKAKEIKKIDHSVLKLANNMLETKKANFGIGIAANQVGELKGLIVIGAAKELLSRRKLETIPIPQTILINPKITQFSKEQENLEEGCLSLPGLQGLVLRAKKIKVKGLDLNGKKIKLNASGFFARVLQHEIDHLNGILFPDRVEDIKTLKAVPLPYKIVFLGTPEFSVPALESLIKEGFGISLVVTESDKPAGRKQVLTPPPIKRVALKRNLLVYQPEKISNLKSQILNLKPDLIILAAYGKILPKEILKIPKYGALCLHPSLLPKYRGPSPIQVMILNGEKETGVTIFLMDEKVDHGPIIQNLKLKTKNLNLTTEELSKKLAKMGAELLLKALPLYLEGKIKLQKQDEEKATYTRLIKKEDGYVSISKIKNQKSKRSLEEIERKIRAFYPWPKVWTIVNGKRVIIHKAHLSLLADRWSLIPDIVQPEGKKPMKYEEYLKGNPKIT